MKPVVKYGSLSFPHQIAQVGDTTYVSDGYGKAIVKLTGQDVAKVVSDGPLMNPVGVAAQNGTLLIADSRAKKVFRLRGDKVEEVASK